MATLVRDLRYAVRMLRRSPAFTTVAILTLALGIGANTAIFTLVNATLRRMLPVRDAQQLVILTDPDSNGTDYGTDDGRRGLLAYTEYKAIRDQNQVFSGVMAAQSFTQDLHLAWGSGGDAEKTGVKVVSGNYFDVLGVAAYRGRTFGESEAVHVNADPIAVMSYAYWQSRFHADPGAIGRTFSVQGHVFTVIGVMPPGFFGESVGDAPALWMPISMAGEILPGRDRLNDPPGISRLMWLQVMGRLKPGVTVKQADAAVNIIFKNSVARQAAAASDEATRKGVLDQHLELAAGGRGSSSVRGQMSDPLLALFALVGLVLLIAIANLASMLLARATARRKEMGVRLALGAGRARLVRQLLTESLVLALAGGVAGFFLARVGVKLLLDLVATPNSSIQLDLHPDLWVFGFTLLLCVVAGILFGLAPAFAMARLNLNATLQSQGRGGSAAQRTVLARMVPGGLPLGKLLVIGQIALSVVLLVGAGLFVRSLTKLTQVSLGYNPDHLLLFTIDGASAGYQGARATQLFQTLLDRFSALPGGAQVTLSGNGLFSGSESGLPIEAEGYVPADGKPYGTSCDIVAPGYFTTTGMTLILGRALDVHDSNTRHVVINQTMAQKFWPRSNPLGKHIRDTYPDDKGAVYDVVGVVQDAKHRSLREKPNPRFFGSFFGGFPWEPSQWAVFEVRTAGPPAAFEAGARTTLRELDPKLTIPEFHPMAQLVDASLTAERMMSKLSSFFGALALLLAAVGLYGVMSYGVARRTSEIGVRMALGAGRGAVLWMILREILWLAALGLGLGLPASIAAAKLISTQLFGLAPYDPLTLGLAALLLTAVALVAGLLPANRASRVDPLQALRYE